MFRIGHMGYVNEFDIVLAISAVEKCLHENGYKNRARQRSFKGTGNSGGLSNKSPLVPLCKRGKEGRDSNFT
jgi:hypothetical protein